VDVSLYTFLFLNLQAIITGIVNEMTLKYEISTKIKFKTKRVFFCFGFCLYMFWAI